MVRHIDKQKIEQVFQTIRKYPGERPGFIARMLGFHRSEVTRLLPALEEKGYLLSEDDRDGYGLSRSHQIPDIAESFM